MAICSVSKAVPLGVVHSFSTCRKAVDIVYGEVIRSSPGEGQGRAFFHLLLKSFSIESLFSKETWVSLSGFSVQGWNAGAEEIRDSSGKEIGEETVVIKRNAASMGVG